MATTRGLLSRRRLLVGGAAVAALAATAAPLGARAATSSTGTLALLGGGLSISGMSTFTTTATSLSAGSLATPMNNATWADNTGTGAGWNGTVAVTQFVDQGAWTQTSGTTASLQTTSSGAYTGTAGAGSIDLTVTLDSLLNVTYTYTDIENGVSTPGAGTAIKGTATSLTNGITITFASGTTYSANAVYDVKFGILPTSALALNTSQASVSATGTTQGGANLPAFQNNSTTVTAGGPTTAGSAVKFVSAAVNTGKGTFSVTPGSTITWDPNNVWPANYTASLQYNIVSGP